MRGLAVLSLAFGIIGVVFCWFGAGIIPAVLALILGLTACFNRIARAIAVTGLILGIIGVVIAGGVLYTLNSFSKNPEIIWTSGLEKMEDFVENGKFLEQYSEDVIKMATENAEVPRILVVIKPRSYMELVINELMEHPEMYPKEADKLEMLKG